MIAQIDASSNHRGSVTPEDMVRELQDLPLAPKVLPRLKRLLSDTNCNMQEIATLIRFDPAIAARVIQVANSSYYSKGVRCPTASAGTCSRLTASLPPGRNASRWNSGRT